MRDYKSLCHTRWDCKYHIVFIPKKRRKLIFGNIRKHLGEVFHDLARQKGVVIEEGHLMRDHVHMCLSIPPKYSVSTVGLDEDMVKEYIRNQEKNDVHRDQLNIGI
jgi:putative transposase